MIMKTEEKAQSKPSKPLSTCCNYEIQNRGNLTNEKLVCAYCGKPVEKPLSCKCSPADDYPVAECNLSTPIHDPEVIMKAIRGANEDQRKVVEKAKAESSSESSISTLKQKKRGNDCAYSSPFVSPDELGNIAINDF